MKMTPRGPRRRSAEEEAAVRAEQALLFQQQGDTREAVVEQQGAAEDNRGVSSKENAEIDATIRSEAVSKARSLIEEGRQEEAVKVLKEAGIALPEEVEQLFGLLGNKNEEVVA